MAARHNIGTSDYAERAEWLLTWLSAHRPDTIPKLGSIGQLCKPRSDGYGIHSALVSLRSSGRITWRSGTRSKNRGHQAIRLKDGRVLKTVGCPFDPPDFVLEAPKT